MEVCKQLQVKNREYVQSVVVLKKIETELTSLSSSLSKKSHKGNTNNGCLCEITLHRETSGF